MKHNTYTAEEVSALTGFDAQSLRSQVKSDIAQGKNSENFNAFQVGNTLRFPKNWIDRKLGIGPAIEVPSWFADLIMKLGMAVADPDKEETGNDEEG